MVEVIRDKQKWDSFLESVGKFDFYHTFDYHALSKNENEQILLFTFQEGEVSIGIPMVYRKIEDSVYYDVTSVYGYAGPILKNSLKGFDLTSFTNALNSFFRDHKIVSAFSRLNPFISHQNDALKSIGTIENKGEIVVIDLSKPLDLQRQGYQRRIKSQINKARRLCDIKKAKSEEDIMAFIDIYYATMDRVNAAKSYYFDKAYFMKFLGSDSIQTDLLLVTLKETGETIAGAMFVKTNTIVQYHLSGTKAEFLSYTPIKLLIDEMRINATQEGYNYFNLGGGLGSTEDSLLRFKMSFSKELHKFSVWKHIVDPAIYDKLVVQNGSRESDYFPAYRSSN